MPTQTLSDLIKLIIEKRGWIMKICGIVCLGSIIIAAILPNEFRSTAVFYPASDDLSRPNVIFSLTNERTYFYGGANERDRILAISQSKDLFNLLDKKFDFHGHYNIESKGMAHHAKAEKKFRKNFDIIKTDLDAIELSFVDKDPAYAADIANGSIAILDSLTSNIIKSSQIKFLASLENKMTDTRADFRAVNDSINKLRNEFGFYDTNGQIAMISRIVTMAKTRVVSEQARLDAYLLAGQTRRDTVINIKGRIAGFQSQLNSIEHADSTTDRGLDIKKLIKIKPILETLEGYYYTLKSEIARDEIILSKIRIANDTRIPAIHIIDKATPPSQKFKPRRKILVLGATLGALIFSILGILFFEGLQSV